MGKRKAKGKGLTTHGSPSIALIISVEDEQSIESDANRFHYCDVTYTDSLNIIGMEGVIL